MVPHGQFYCHFYKIKIRTAELHYSGKKIDMCFNFRLIQSISGIKSQNKNIVEKWWLTWFKSTSTGCFYNQLSSPDS
jgi:hypothetical protein